MTTQTVLENGVREEVEVSYELPSWTSYDEDEYNRLRKRYMDMSEKRSKEYNTLRDELIELFKKTDPAFQYSDYLAELIIEVMPDLKKIFKKTNIGYRSDYWNH